MIFLFSRLAAKVIFHLSDWFAIVWTVYSMLYHSHSVHHAVNVKRTSREKCVFIIAMHHKLLRKFNWIYVEWKKERSAHVKWHVCERSESFIKILHMFYCCKCLVKTVHLKIIWFVGFGRYLQINSRVNIFFCHASINYRMW